MCHRNLLKEDVISEKVIILYMEKARDGEKYHLQRLCEMAGVDTGPTE